MKLVKLFEDYNKINETCEWYADVDWDYVKDNPDADDDCSLWIKDLESKLNDVKSQLESEDALTIEDIEGFDMYQGPYATVDIKGTTYKVWTVGDGGENQLWIEDFPVDNTSEHGLRAGFQGNAFEVAEAINGIV